MDKVSREGGWFSRWGLGWLVPVLALLGTVVDVSAAEPGSASQHAAKVLVDRARSYAVDLSGTESIGDARLMLVWFEAAERLDPGLPDAQLGLYHLLGTLGRPEAAGAALQRYTALAPDHHVLQLAALGERFEQLQTAEQRLAFCTEHLAGPGLSASAVSELNCWLAETNQGIGEVEAARRLARTALEAQPFNFAAWDLAFALADSAPRPVDRVEQALAGVTAAPSRVDGLHSVARLLELLSLPDRAIEWYDAALERLPVRPANREARLPLLLERVECLREAGRLDDALAAAAAVAEKYSDSFAARLLCFELHRDAGRSEMAERYLEELKKYAARQEVIVRETRDPDQALQIAEFHLDSVPAASKALEFAELARAEAPRLLRAQRTYGLALLAADQPARAREILAPLGTAPLHDPQAAWGLARALVIQGDQPAAIAVLRDAELTRRSGPAYRRISALLQELGQVPRPAPDRKDIIAVLDRFDRDILLLPTEPGRFVELSIAAVDAEPRFGQRWSCRLTLTNRGSFPIALGPQQVIRGEVLLSAAPQAPGIGAIPGYVPLSLARRHVLAPGEQVSVVQTVDVGPLAEVALMMPQRHLDVTITAVLDPEAGVDTPVPPAQAVTASTVIHRGRFTYDRAGVSGLVDTLRSGRSVARMEALHTAAALLAERLAAMRQEFDYRPARVDRAGLDNLLHYGMQDADPLVRAAAIRSLALLPLKEERLSAVAPLLSDEHWLVRLTAVDVLASRQGPTFRPVAERLAESEADELVRELAGLYVQQWEAVQK